MDISPTTSNNHVDTAELIDVNWRQNTSELSPEPIPEISSTPVPSRPVDEIYASSPWRSIFLPDPQTPHNIRNPHRFRIFGKKIKNITRFSLDNELLSFSFKSVSSVN